MVKSLKWGIAGCGKISRDFIGALKLLPGDEHQAVACAAQDKGRAQQFAKEMNIAQSYGSYEELAQNPDVDIVYVGTVHTTHCKVSCLFMNAGKPVLCEKPLAMNTKEVQLMVDTAKKNCVFFMEAMWSRFFPVYDKLRETLTSGAIGKVGHVSVSFGKKNLIHVPRIADKQVGGGLLMDLGCYPIQLALAVYGEDPGIIQSTGGDIGNIGVDWFENITLIFSDDRTAQLTLHGKEDLSQEAIISGTEGLIRIPNFWCPTEITINDKKFEFPLPLTGKMLHPNSEGLMYEAKACRESIQHRLKEHPLMSHEHSLIIMKILDKIRQQLGIVYAADA